MPLEAAEAPSAADAERRALKLSLHDDGGRYRVLDQIWKHRARRGRETALVPFHAATVEDVGEIAVVRDQGDLILQPNPFDLGGIGLRFSPDGGGYDVGRIDAAFRSSLGSPLTLDDDDTTEAQVAFAFPLYGQSQTRAFVNSDGNITFGARR